MKCLLNRPLALVILDGWGFAANRPADLINRAHTPFYDHIRRNFPSTTLAASGEDVGLDAGQAGNAEIGHMNLGAGRTVRSGAMQIARAIRTGEFQENKALDAIFRSSVEGRTRVHLIGLLSDAGVHSSMETLYELLRMAKWKGAEDVIVHAILDGRDVPARTADTYVEALELKMNDIGVGRIGSLCGRFFGMDSGGRWERTARAYTMLVHGEGERSTDAVSAVRNSFLRGLSDEFIPPVILQIDADDASPTIRDGDAVIFFNHRGDAARQLVRSLVSSAPTDDGLSSKPALRAVCLTEYDSELRLPVAFGQHGGASTLGSVLSLEEVNNYRIAESERFVHVTRFLNAGVDRSGTFERQVHVTRTNELLREAEPEMESFRLTDRALRAMEADPSGVFVANLSAADVAGEKGDLPRLIEAAQFIDTCVEGIVETVTNFGGTAVITSSHGGRQAAGKNSFSDGGTVPFHLVARNTDGVKLREGSLADVTPTILSLLGIEVPDDMTGSDLRWS